MTLQQLRYLIAIADSGLNITLAAERVYATQPGISKQLKQLEDELGLRIFTRKGKSLDSITPAGQTIIERARVILREAANIKALAADSRADAKGAITIATTHTQARFVLPETLARFRQRYPDVSLHIAQESDADIVAKVKSGAVEFGFNSSTGAASEGLISLPAYRWQRVVLVPKDHPLSQLKRPLQIADLAKYPLVSYDSSVNADSSLNQAFRDQGLTPKFAITARDADVIKTYVRAGMGVGILAEIQHSIQVNILIPAGLSVRWRPNAASPFVIALEICGLVVATIGSNRIVNVVLVADYYRIPIGGKRRTIIRQRNNRNLETL